MMIRRLIFVVAVAALPFALLVRANSAWAGPPPIDVSTDNITCNTVTGSAKIAPALNFLGSPANPPTISIKGTLDGCTDTTNGSVIIHASKFKGVLTGFSNNCTALNGAKATTGSITVKWKADSSTPINPKTSTLTLSAGAVLTGGQYTPAAPLPGMYGSFSIGGSFISVTDAFAGSNGGATSTMFLVTGQDTAALGNQCALPLPGGIKAITLGIGTVTLQ